MPEQEFSETLWRSPRVHAHRGGRWQGAGDAVWPARQGNVLWPLGGGQIFHLRSAPCEGLSALWFDFRLGEDLHVGLDPTDELLLTFFITGEISGHIGRTHERPFAFRLDHAMLRTPNREGGYVIHIPGGRQASFVQLRLKRRLLPFWLNQLSVNLAKQQMDGLMDLEDGTILCNAAVTPRIKACLGRIKAEDQGHAAFVPLFHARALELMTYSLLDLRELLRPARSVATGAQQLQGLAERVAALVAETPSRRWSVEALASQVGCGPAMLQEAFKCRFGTTVHQSVRIARLELAQKLLLGSNLSVRAIADEVGWECHGRFSSAFRAHYGVTPTAMRRQREGD